jgi:hypothetical protein
MVKNHDVIEQVVPQMYEDFLTDFQYPFGTNPAATNQCHILTKTLHIALQNRGIETRRELHRTEDGLWHFLVAHTPADAEPSEDDVVTDLNPWQFMESAPGHYTFIHDSRQAVMEKLAREGAPDYFISLRGLATIVKSHVEETMPAGLLQQS